MKCENCGTELMGGAIICRACNHNNARRAVSQWRARKTGELQEPPSRQITPIAAEPKITPRKDADDNLLRFPAASRAATAAPARGPAPGLRFSTPRASSAQAAVEPATVPAWRDEVKERVRLAREKRQLSFMEVAGMEAAGMEAAGEAAGETAVEPDEARLDQNPIVESALRRIRRSTPQPATVPAIAPRIVRQPAQAAPARVADEVEIQLPPTPIAPRAEDRFFAYPAPPPVPKRTTKPLPGSSKAKAGGSGESRTLTPKSPAPAMQPEPKPHPLGDSVLLTPRTKSQPLAMPKPGAPRSVRITRDYTPEDQREVTTEIIEIMHTPGQLPLPVARPATMWLRTLAGACDFEIIATAYLPLFGAYATLDTSLGGESLFVMAVLAAAIAFIYQSVMLLMSNRTFGMAMLGLRLVNTDDDEMPVTRRQKMLRAWAATIAFCCPPLNLLITRLNYPNRSLPDLVSGTTIVEK